MRTLGDPDTAITCSTKTNTQFIVWPKWIKVIKVDDGSCRNSIDENKRK